MIPLSTDTSAGVTAISIVFVVCALVVFFVNLYRDRSQLKELVRKLMGHRMRAEYCRNVSDARLASIRRHAAAAIDPDPHPYRSRDGRMIETLRTIVELVDKGMEENCREVSHFNTMGEAANFIRTIEEEKNPYIVYHRMWDGDCYHVLYDVPEKTDD
jgi:hypothetical protein